MAIEYANEPVNGATLSGERMSHGDYLTRYQTASSVVIPREVFESMYLSPYRQQRGHLRSVFGNPTPVPLMGFLMASMPLGCILMGWRGAGGDGAAIIGLFFFCGGTLQIIGSVLEWILGNTFPFIVFACYGAFWLATGATLQPMYNAQIYYDPAHGGAAEFYASYAFFFMVMALLSLFFTVGALRTNVVFVLLFIFVDLTFIMMMATYWLLAEGRMTIAGKCQKAAGAFIFVFCCFGWYLFAGMVLLAVDFPLSLPMGDLSTRFRGRSERQTAKGDKGGKERAKETEEAELQNP